MQAVLICKFLKGDCHGVLSDACPPPKLPYAERHLQLLKKDFLVCRKSKVFLYLHNYLYLVTLFAGFYKPKSLEQRSQVKRCFEIS